MANATIDFAALAGDSLREFNKDYGKSYQFGTNWNETAQDFGTIINKYLFPKVIETINSTQSLGNRFDWLSKQITFNGQFMEEYIILDSVPIDMNLTKPAELMLQRNYPKMATKLYNNGQLKKVKFTLNNNDTRKNFSTLADAVAYARSIFLKRISDINVAEEQEIKTMLVDYALNNSKTQYTANDLEDALNQVGERILNIQNNSSRYNEASLASGGKIARYTTYTALKDVLILTTDKIKARLLDTRLANTFQAAGIDLTDHIVSFDDLGGSFKLNEDVTISDASTLASLQGMGDYQVEVGDIIPSGAVIDWDVSALSDFEGKVTEIKPKTSTFIGIFDINKIKYRRDTQDMLKTPFYNGENDETTYWLHYYSFKAISPFFNSIIIQGKK